MSSAKITNIAKNTSYFTFALILQKVISFTYFTLIARALGPEDLGKYYFAISFTSIFSIFIDIGLGSILTREIAKEKERAGGLLGTIMAIKIPLSIISFILVAVVINLLGYPELTRDLVYLSAICMILDSFSMSFFATIRGFHSLGYESISSVIFQGVVLLTGVAIIRMDLGLRWLMGALVAASIVQVIYSALLIKVKWKLSLKPVFDYALIRQTVILAIPFGLFSIFQKLYTYLDSVFLSLLAGDRYVGLYQISFKIIFALQFLPLAFVASLYPAFSAYWRNNREQLPVTFERAMNYLIIISLPISFGIASLADKIILIFKSEYTEGVLPLQIIMLSLLFIFINFPIGSLLNACDKQKINTVNMAIALVVSVAMNLVLIPLYGASGASITVVATNFLMFIMGIWWVPKIIEYRLSKNLKVFFKSLFSAILMSAVGFYLKEFLNIFLVMPLAGALYFVFLFAMRGIRKEDIVSVWNSFAKKNV